MTNPRDTGRYDAITDTWIDQQVRIDFAWGNIPIQPNDDRGEDTLDPELDSHIIATDGWSSFPEFEPNVGFDIQEVVVPNVVDFDSVSAAEQALLLSELVLGTVTTSTVGATSSNWGWVKSQNPAASTSVAPGTAVNLVSYDYVSAATTGSISGFQRTAIPALGGSLNGDQAVMYVTGRNTWPAVGSTITVTGTSTASYNATYTVVQVAPDDAYNTGGTAIKVTLTSGAFVGTSSSGGTWAFPVAAIFGPTDNWAINMGTLALSSMTTVPAELTNGGFADYRVQIVGGTAAGTHVISNVIGPDMMFSGTYINSDTLTGFMSVKGVGASGGTDVGILSIIPA